MLSARIIRAYKNIMWGLIRGSKITNTVYRCNINSILKLIWGIVDFLFGMEVSSRGMSRIIKSGLT